MIDQLPYCDKSSWTVQSQQRLFHSALKYISDQDLLASVDKHTKNSEPIINYSQNFTFFTYANLKKQIEKSR